MLMLPPIGPPFPRGAVMSMRFLGGETYILPVIFSPVFGVMVMSAEKGCGIWAHAAETARTSTIKIVSFTYAVCFIVWSPEYLDQRSLIYTIRTPRFTQAPFPLTR